MKKEQHYTIGELADLANVTPRTIRYYAAEGLLPPPDARGRHALYNDDHLRRLQLIARLKDAYLPLGEIKARLDQLEAEQVQQLLAEHSETPEPVASVSAAEYIAQVLTTQAAPMPPNQLPAAPAPPDMAQSVPRAAAADPVTRVSEPPAAPTASQPAFQIGRAAPLAAPAPPSPSAPPPSSGGILRKLIPQRRERENVVQPVAQSGESWQRVTLAPGVELHLREPLAPALRDAVERLIAAARELFRDTS